METFVAWGGGDGLEVRSSFVRGVRLVGNLELENLAQDVEGLESRFWEDVKISFLTI